MELESLEFKVVMDDGPDTEVLARAASLDIASAAYLAAVLKHPKRNSPCATAPASSSATTVSPGRSRLGTRTSRNGRCA